MLGKFYFYFCNNAKIKVELATNIVTQPCNNTPLFNSTACRISSATALFKPPDNGNRSVKVNSYSEVKAP
jgi:hypothetical protein